MPEWREVTFDSVYKQIGADDSIQTIEEGLIELITNSDDSYGQLKKDNGVIEIDYILAKKPKKRILIVRDFA